MSKYIKLEDAIHNIDLEVIGRREYTGDMKANLFFALDSLPTIEVSEDCISRAGLLKDFGLSEKSRKYGGDHSGYQKLMLYEIQDIIEDAPSVVPTTEQSSMVGERKPIMTEEEREAIMRLSMCARHECIMCKYRLTDDVDECRDRATKCMNTIVDAFTERKRGEWVERIGAISKMSFYQCSKCYGEVDTNVFDYCLWCGRKMKG